MSKVIIQTDGASRGNPGPAAWGAVFLDENRSVVAEHYKAIGTNTNNYAEYMAILEALKQAKEDGYSDIILESDSQLLVKQLTGEYRVKAANLKPLFMECKALSDGFKSCQFVHVRREFNKLADALANRALDEDY